MGVLAMSRLGEHSFTFGPFRLHPREGTLTRAGEPVPLTPKEFDTLLTLVEAGGRVVCREEIIDRVWPDSYVGDGSLARNISVLRKTLGAQVIETISRRGYRLTMPVSVVSSDTAAPQQQVDDIRSRGNLSNPALVLRPSMPYTRLLGILAIVLCGMGASLVVRARQQSNTTPIRSVVVVVSAIPGDDLQSEILAEAAGETVVHSLRRAQTLKIVAAHSLAPSGQAVDMGKQFGFDAVLLVQSERTGDKFSVRLEMLNSRTGVQLWDETITGRVAEAAWIQAEVGEVVVRGFDIARQSQTQQIANSAAFQDYLRGRYFWNKRTPENLQEAFTSFRAAIQEDPNFALAYAGLAQTYAVADLHDLRYRAREETYREARQAVDRALQIDPRLASAHAALAQILRNHDRDMPGAEREYLTAIQLDPSDATAHQWYAEFLSINGRYDEAIAQIDEAHELEPLSAVVTAVCGFVRVMARRYTESLPYSYEALRLDPHYYSIYSNVDQAMEGLGRYPEALDALAKQAEVSHDPAEAEAVRQDREAFLRGGATALWNQRLKRALRHTDSRDREYVLAELYCRNGDVEHCLKMLERSVDEHGETVTGIKVDPAFDVLHDQPRYAALVRKFGFTVNVPQTVSHATGSAHLAQNR
jgi:DNA-binding winged helix-turn-helix (wHTH) protein/tetratricopeptide (TPR) repeat protein